MSANRPIRGHDGNGISTRRTRFWVQNIILNNKISRVAKERWRSHRKRETGALLNKGKEKDSVRLCTSSLGLPGPLVLGPRRRLDPRRGEPPGHRRALVRSGFHRKVNHRKVNCHRKVMIG
jgi:hypothetical protein